MQLNNDGKRIRIIGWIADNKICWCNGQYWLWYIFSHENWRKIVPWNLDGVELFRLLSQLRGRSWVPDLWNNVEWKKYFLRAVIWMWLMHIFLWQLLLHPYFNYLWPYNLWTIGQSLYLGNKWKAILCKCLSKLHPQQQHFQLICPWFQLRNGRILWLAFKKKLLLLYLYERNAILLHLRCIA